MKRTLGLSGGVFQNHYTEMDTKARNSGNQKLSLLLTLLIVSKRERERSLIAFSGYMPDVRVSMIYHRNRTEVEQLDSEIS